MDIKHYRHAIVGCGRIAPIHKEAFEALGISDIDYCDLMLDRALTLSEKESNVYTDYLKIPTDTLNSVSVCTDHVSHLNIADYFLSKGVSVIVEKPFCLPQQDLQTFLHKHSTPYPILTQIMQHRYDSIVNFVKSLIDNGKLGHIVQADFTLWCNRPESYFKKSPWKGKYATEGGSAVINQAFHLVDLINFFFGVTNKVDSYLCNYWMRDVIETDETAYALFHYPSFCVSFKTTICSSELWRTRLDIIGDKGMVSFSIDEPFSFYYYSDSVSEDVKKYLNDFHQDCVRISPHGYFGNSHKKQIKAFVQSVINRNYNHLPDTDTIATTQQLINSLYL